MKVRSYIFLFVGLMLSSCEDVIDINLNDAAPKLIIVGEIDNRTTTQRVTISKTVAFTSENPFDPVQGAQVEVVDGAGRVYRFSEQAPGVYVAANFRGQENTEYSLAVQVEGKQFNARSTMPRLVTVDSVGTSVTNFFGEERKFVSLKYQDPPNEPNYYRYLMSVNGGPFNMVYATSDKFNDGKYVSEDVADFDLELFSGDSVIVYMQCIDKATFDFWNAVQSTNPGSAAPANPPSVFGDEALGYFSAHSVSEISTTIQ